MGVTFADIQLTNLEDIGAFKRNFIREDEVRSVNIRSLVDSGALMLVIPQSVCRELGLTIEEFRTAYLANGTREQVPMTSAVEVRWKWGETTRKTVVNAIVTGDEPLLGAIPMEGLDVVIDPAKQELVPHPDSPDVPHLVLMGIPKMC
jgi:clan AA aspartic protease